MKSFKKEFSYLIIAIAVVLIWRGVWGFADLFIFPKNDILSFSLSIILGIFLLRIYHESLRDLF